MTTPPEVCALRPELDRSAGPLRWRAECEHGKCVSGNWGPRNVGELERLKERDAERTRLIAAGEWPKARYFDSIPFGAPWWDDADEFQASFHLEELRRVWVHLHERAHAAAYSTSSKSQVKEDK